MKNSTEILLFNSAAALTFFCLCSVVVWSITLESSDVLSKRLNRTAHWLMIISVITILVILSIIFSMNMGMEMDMEVGVMEEEMGMEMEMNGDMRMDIEN